MMKRQKSERISLYEALRLNLRALAVWNKERPGLLTAMILSTAVGALAPYVNIYLSAKVISELAGGRDPERLVFLVLLTLGTALVLSVLVSCLNRWKNAVGGGQWIVFQSVLSQKMLHMDYASVIDPEVKQLLGKIRDNNMYSSWGISSALYSVEPLTRSVFKIIGGIALTVMLFVRKVPQGGGVLTVLNSPWFIAAVIALMLALIFVSPALSSKADSYWAKNANNAAFDNRLFGFYLFMGYDRHRAPDIRMYRQDRIVDSYPCKNGFGPSVYRGGLSVCLLESSGRRLRNRRGDTVYRFDNGAFGRNR